MAFLSVRFSGAFCSPSSSVRTWTCSSGLSLSSLRSTLELVSPIDLPRLKHSPASRALWALLAVKVCPGSLALPARQVRKGRPVQPALLACAAFPACPDPAALPVLVGSLVLAAVMVQQELKASLVASVLAVRSVRLERRDRLDRVERMGCGVLLFAQLVYCKLECKDLLLSFVLSLPWNDQRPRPSIRSPLTRLAYSLTAARFLCHPTRIREISPLATPGSPLKEPGETFETREPLRLLLPLLAGVLL